MPQFCTASSVNSSAMRPIALLTVFVAAVAAKPSGVAAPLAAVVAPLAAVAAPLAAVATPIVAASHYHAQDEIGQYSYGYSNPLSAKSEIRAANGQTVGAYSYVDPDGKLQSVEYSADAAHGFRVAATNLPVEPALPLVPKLVSPEPVKDTPEVVEARSQHLNALKAAEQRAKANAEAIIALRSTVGALSNVAVKTVPTVALANAPTLALATPTVAVATRKAEAAATPADTVKTSIEPLEAAPLVAKTVESKSAAASKIAEPSPVVSAIKTVENFPGATVQTSVTEVRTVQHNPLGAAVLVGPALSFAAPAIQTYSIGINPLLAGHYLAQPLTYSAHFLAGPALVGGANAVLAEEVSVEATAKSGENKEDKKNDA